MSQQQIEQQPIKKSHPIILVPLKQREDQSDKSLFKNDSLSSYQAERVPPVHQQISTYSGLPEVDQIRKFLKRGDLLNTNTLKKLQEDKQINQLAKHDRSSASLYKGSRNLQFPLNQQDKNAQIRRLYLSHKKQPAKLHFRSSLSKPQRTSIEVQTEEQQLPLEISQEPQQPISFHPLHKPSYMTIDLGQEQGKGKERQVEPDLEQNKQLPQREKRGGNLVRAKALSHHQANNNHTNNVNSYLQAINRLDFSFHSNLSKYSQRYKEYRDQQTVFSKTIDVKPLKPMRQTLSNFAQQSDFKSQPTTAILERGESGLTHQIVGVSSLKPVTVEQKAIQVRAQTKAEKRSKQFYLQPKQSPVIKQATNERDSSLRPEHSNEMHSNSRSKHHQVNNRSQITSRFSVQNKVHNDGKMMTHNSRHESNYSKNNKQKPVKYVNKNKELKKSYIVQVPSQHQLKVGQGQPIESKFIHPIRSTFGASEVDWIHRYYRPKNDFLKEISQSNFQIKKYQNGVYFGQLSNQGKKQGRGAIFYYSGKIYQGDLLNDLKYGVGHEYYPDGSCYKGQWKDGIRHGRGIFEWSNGEIYDGEWISGRKTGSGMWTSPDSESYIGQWKNDKVQGFGVFVMKNGSRYEGQFKNSLKHGMGTQRFSNGQTYVGNYQRNRPNGQGQYYWSNGDYYKGNFSNGLRHGEGYFKEGKTGIQYRGQYHNDKKCGFGQIDYHNGMIYGGNFQNNFRHGYGELSEQGKMKYRGYWINDNQVDQNNHPPFPTDSIVNKGIGIGVIEEVNQKQQTLPKPLPRKVNKKQKREKSISPQGQKQGYLRSCGCNRKH